MASPDISNEIPFDIGQPTLPSNIYYNTGIQYDVAVGGLPFILATSDQRPLERVTAPYRKQQFDSAAEPGEQSLTGWWIRSQSSFHRGAGIKYYDPSAGEEVQYRFRDSRNVDVWTPGEVTLLRKLNAGHITTNGRQWLRSIKDGTTDAILMLDGHDLDKIYGDGTEEHFVDYNAGTDKPVYAFCDDGEYAFWVIEILDSGAPKLAVLKKLLTQNSTDPNTTMFTTSSILPADGKTIMEFVKGRIIFANKNSIYELTPSSTSLPTALYTHPTSSYTFSAIAESGSAIYVAGYSGTQSSIFKFSLNTTGGIPTLTGGNVAAEMPAGENITAMYGYLGLLLIGTSAGVRVAQVNDNGDLVYGPLIFESEYPVYDFACRDRFAYCAAGVGLSIGLRRIDLSQQIASLQFAWANDHMLEDGFMDATTGVAFLGSSDRLTLAAPSQNVTGTITSLSATGTTVTYTVANTFQIGDVVNVLGMVPIGYDAYGATVTASDGTSFTIANTTTAPVTIYGYANLAGNVYIEDETDFVEEGWIETGRIRLGTLEPKHFKRFDLRANLDYGTLQVNVIDTDNAEYEVIEYTPSIGTPEVSISPIQSSREYLSFKMILRRDSVTNSLGPILNGYQVKALPASPRQHLIQIPVFIFDVETDRFNNQTGYLSRAWERVQALEGLDSTGDEVIYQDFNTGEQFTCVIEEVSFRAQTPPDKRFSGFGGFANIIVRKL